MTDIKDFGFLGGEFQMKVISQILCDRVFGLNIIEIMNPKYFDNANYRQIVSMIKDYNQKFENSLPTISGLKEKILVEVKDEIQREYLLTILNDLAKKSLEDDKATQTTASNFCKQQEVKKALTKIESIIKKGAFEDYSTIEEIMRNALAVGEKHDDSVEVSDDIDSVLEEDYRKPIPTGIDGIDESIGGGLGKGEFGLFLAPTGVGKSTFLTKVANTAYNMGHNVLQIIFEDNKKDIQRKHYTCWTGIPMKELSKHKELVKEVSQNQKSGGGRLIIKKCSSDSTTINHVKQYLRFLRNKGITIDMLVLDYIDCITPSRINDDQTANEGTVVRQFESLVSEFNIIGWSALQSNRTGVNADVVLLDQMGGSFKRAQVAHLVISAGKTLEQKEKGTATMAILKSRFGGDGVVFKDMTFDNATMYFDTNEKVSQLGYETDKTNESRLQSQQKALAAINRMNNLKTTV